MDAAELARELGWSVRTRGEGREVTTGFCGDLLSSVLSHAPEGCAWLTVMTNVNVAAVALLRGVSCVVLAQGAQPDALLAERAERERLPLFTTEEDVYTAALRLGRLLERRA